jgi:hypothetical protein
MIRFVPPPGEIRRQGRPCQPDGRDAPTKALDPGGGFLLWGVSIQGLVPTKYLPPVRLVNAAPHINQNGVRLNHRDDSERRVRVEFGWEAAGSCGPMDSAGCERRLRRMPNGW